MTSLRLTGWGGVATMLAGVAFMVQALLPSTGPNGFGYAIHYVALVLLAMGMVGFHILQKDHYGRIGRASIRLS